jgi:ABC-type dipeptide/oligopeptide/nickel transport system permease subunit
MNLILTSFASASIAFLIGYVIGFRIGYDKGRAEEWVDSYIAQCRKARDRRDAQGRFK